VLQDLKKIVKENVKVDYKKLQAEVERNMGKVTDEKSEASTQDDTNATSQINEKVQACQEFYNFLLEFTH